MNTKDQDFERIESAARSGAELGRALLDEVAAQFDPSHPKKLIDVLSSNEPRLVESGLYIFVRIGERGLAVVDQVLALIAHLQTPWRFEISMALAELGRKLTASQLTQCLWLVEDEHVGIRRYMCLLLSEVGEDVLAEAVMLQNDPGRQAAHVSSQRLLQSPPPVERLVELIASKNLIESCYAGASLIRHNLDAEQLRAVEMPLCRSDLGRALRNHLPLRRPRP
jgi:hypothetical protein